MENSKLGSEARHKEKPIPVLVLLRNEEKPLDKALSYP